MKSKCKEFQRLEEYFSYLKNYFERMKTTLTYWNNNIQKLACEDECRYLLLCQTVTIFFT